MPNSYSGKPRLLHDKHSPSSETTPNLIPPCKVKEILGLQNERTLAVWRTTRRYPALPWVKVGRKVMYRLADVYRFIEQRTVGGESNE